MPSLSRELRRLLERTIAGTDGTRQIAEAGAEQSLQRLAVDRHEPHSALTVEERTLRNQLRAHGRQLGDKRDLQRGTQTIDHLKQAVAYEHWHRLLFARFLAENDLLMHPEHGVALTLDEVKELALGNGVDWIALAAEYAQRMLLREVFRSDDPALRVPLSPEKRRDLEEKLNSLPREIFLAADSLGWVYQFWQRDAKDDVNRSEVKVGADELPAVTQLFTEDYMVLFLLENTLGAWWTAKRRSEGKDAVLPGYDWTYLRLNDDGSPAAGSFDGWPRSSKQLRVLDPCMGSGHFLVFALPMLARMRMEEEGLSLKDALASVLRDNLFGLEIDPRCSQIAAFNLALAAWRMASEHFDLPALQLACSGLGPNCTKEQWMRLAEEVAADGGMPSKVNLFDSEDSLLSEPARNSMESLYELFSQAPILGSLIDPGNIRGHLFEANYPAVAKLFTGVLSAQSADENTRERLIAAAGMMQAATLLAGKYTLVVTNVPYLGRGKQSSTLAEYCAVHHLDAKADLATCFVERCLRFNSKSGSAALVTPQNWLFLTTYTKLRKTLLGQKLWNVVARLGPNAFQDMNWWAATTALLVLTSAPPDAQSTVFGIDVSSEKQQDVKAKMLGGKIPHGLFVALQTSQLKNPDARVTLTAPSETQLLQSVAKCLAGILNGDSPKFQRSFWEFPDVPKEWVFQQSTVEANCYYGGRSLVIYFDEKDGHLREDVAIRRDRLHNSDQRGNSAWGRRGICINQMNSMPVSLYTGEKFDSNVAVISPASDDDVAAIWCFVQSSDFRGSLRSLDSKVNVTNATIAKVPFDRAHWQKIAAEQYPNGLPGPHSDDPTQWLFDGHPRSSKYPLQVAVARLLSYRWPRQTGSYFQDCPALVPDGLEKHAAADGIVCLSSVAGQESAGTRLRSLLQTALGADYSLVHLLDGKRSTTLEGWLRDEFFEQHCQLLDQRPFVWHIWDGLKDGFHALVNYHKLDHRNLEKLIFSYLGDWITRQRQDVQNGVEGADTRLAAAEHLQGELKKILEGERPYDIFARWKPLGKQPVGWTPDLADGVRINIRPWITEAKVYKTTRPGLLRVTPNIKYTKDRGKEPDRSPIEFPWFTRSSDRLNDVHLSVDEKKRARGLS